jgi:transketolase
VLPKKIRKRLSVEAASTQGWIKYTTENGKSLGLDHFGESAPAEDLFKEFGFTVENIVTLVRYL